MCYKGMEALMFSYGTFYFISFIYIPRNNITLQYNNCIISFDEYT